MKKKGMEIVEIDITEVITLLNKALADEWLAYYQYWIGSKVVQGKMSDRVQKELEEHAEEELKHANMLVERIVQLNGTPLLTPEEWNKQTTCGYTAPKDFSTTEILKQNIQGEQCAIEVYNKILKLTKDKDVITYHMVLEILTEEVEHENDLITILEDITI
jgi:bacterioferritin